MTAFSAGKMQRIEWLKPQRFKMFASRSLRYINGNSLMSVR